MQTRNSRLLFVAGVASIGLLLIAAVEFSVFAVVSLLRYTGIFFDRQVITQDYEEYLALRHPTLGWIAPGSDEQAARPDPGPFAATTPCVDVFGDSFTYGTDVADAEAWPALLSEKLACRVRNFGVGGYGTDQALLRFRSVTDPAPIVVFSHYAEDTLRNLTQFLNFLYRIDSFGFKPRLALGANGLAVVDLPEIPATDIDAFFARPADFLDDDYFLPGGPAGIQAARFPWSWRLVGALGHWQVRARLAGVTGTKPFYDPEHKSGALDLSTAILLSFAREARATGVQPLTAIIPSCRELEHHERAGHFPYLPMLERLAAAGEPVVDLGKEIRSRLPDFHSLYLDDCRGHMNERGNALLAELFFDHLARLRP